MGIVVPPLNIPALTRSARPQLVANRGQQLLFLLQSDGWTRLNSRYRFTAGPGGIVWLQVAFDNFCTPTGSGEQLNSNSITVDASVEITAPQRPSPDGAVPAAFPLTFAGASSVTINPGGRVLSDPIAVNMDPGAEAFVRTSIPVVNGFFVPVGHSASTTGEGAYTGTGSSQANATGPLSVTGNAIITNGYGPAAIIGKTRTGAPSVIVNGDSNGIGAGDKNIGDGLGNIGYLMRGLAAAGADGTRLPSVWQCRGGDWQAGWQARNASRRQTYWQYASAAILQLGTNDLSLGRTAANTFIDLQAMCKWMRGEGISDIAVMTLVPRVSSSSDNFRTAAGQTIQSGFGPGGSREAFNAMLPQLVQQGLANAILDTNPHFEDPLNPGKWVSDGATANYATSDGAHISEALSIIAANAVIKPWAQRLQA